MDGTNFYLDHFHFFHFHFNQHSNPQLGAKPEKTVLGVPLYGRSFLLQNKANNGGKMMMMMMMMMVMMVMGKIIMMMMMKVAI